MSDTVDTLKQRVVGAFVIISLAVIFLPMIFDEPTIPQSNIIVPVPPRPAFKVIEIEKPTKPEFQILEVDKVTQKVFVKQEQLVSQETLVNSKPEQASQEAVANEKIPPEQVIIKSKAKSTPEVEHLPIFKNVWMVQLGTFSNTVNAYQLRDSLRKDGFDGHTKKIELSNGKPAVRVFTGPFVDKREAEKIKLIMDQKYKVKSQVIFFDA